MTNASPLTSRAYYRQTRADSWKEIWEAGPYYDRVAELLEDAEGYAIFVGWQIDSRLPLKSPVGGPEETLKAKILRLCEAKPDFHFYFLIWDHAYFYVLEREWWQGRIWDDVHPRVHFIFDNRHPFGGSHHEKICLIQRANRNDLRSNSIALIGGIDLCGDRWDSPEHLHHDPRRSLDRGAETHGPYHDLAVEVTGPVCDEIHEHIAQRWTAISSVPFPAQPLSEPTTTPGHVVYFSRTLTSIESAREPLIREIEFLFRDLVNSAKNRIILEGQYYWSREINDLLIAKMHAMKGQGLQIVLILADLTQTKSLTRLMARYELTLLEQLEQAARVTGTSLIMGCPYVHQDHGARAVYVHSKLLIIDDRYISVGSANFASRALRIDTEISLCLEARTDEERAHIRAVGDRILAHWAITGNHTSSRVRLHHFRPRLKLAHHGSAPLLDRPWRTSFPFQWFFDPRVPWPYRLKRAYRKVARRRAWLSAALICTITVMGTGLVIWLSGDEGQMSQWPLIYAFLLSSSWWLPVPFLPISIVASLQLGTSSAAQIYVTSLWVASFLGYSLARAFPAAAARYYNRIGPSWLPEKLGRRSFEALIGVLSDPRVELRSKIAYQGIHCVPFPWFVLGTWILLPAAIYIACRLVESLIPNPLLTSVRNWPSNWILGLLALTAMRGMRRNRPQKERNASRKKAA